LHSSWLRSEEFYHDSVSGFGDKAYLSGFTRGLSELGWTDGRNLRMDVRWAAGSVDRARIYAKELVNVQPDVIVANSTPVTAALQRETRAIPIVFAGVADPVGQILAHDRKVKENCHRIPVAVKPWWQVL
jgi:ABC-type uncharacterized transport system substrate-binding protein